MMSHRRTVPFAGLLSVALLALLASVLAAPPAAAQDEVTPARISGADRVATAAEIAEYTYPGGAADVLLARADDFPDALAAAGLAGQVDGPVLLTESTALPDRTAQTLETLGTENVYVLGGEAAIGPDVVTELQSGGYDVGRLEGADRYGTAAEIARETVRQGPINEIVGDARAVFIAYGGSFEDALSAGAPAAADPVVPILLTENDELPQATVDAIEDLNLEYAYVLGGELAVSDDVVTELQGLGMTTQRLAGETAQGTATAIANEFTPLLLDGPTTVLARGDEFADALAAGPHAGAIGGPILLTQDPDTLGQATRDYLAAPPAEIGAIRAIGGDAAITPGTLATAVGIVGTGGAPSTTDQTYVVAPQEALTATPGTAVEFRVIGRYDGGDLTSETLDLALFPCDAASVVGAQRVTFTDADDNGLADRIGTTDTGEASIATLNGEDIADDDLFSDVVVRDGQVSFRIFSSAPDCTVPVVWQDEDGDGGLDVGGSDVGEVPIEPFGVGKVTFE